MLCFTLIRWRAYSTYLSIVQDQKSNSGWYKNQDYKEYENQVFIISQPYFWRVRFYSTSSQSLNYQILEQCEVEIVIFHLFVHWVVTVCIFHWQNDFILKSMEVNSCLFVFSGIFHWSYKHWTYQSCSTHW